MLTFFSYNLKMPENAQKCKMFLEFNFLFSGSLLYQENGIFFSEIEYSEC